MIGYMDSGYRLWSVDDKKKKILRKVVFYENKMIADLKVGPDEVSHGRLIEFSLFLWKNKKRTAHR